MQYGKVWHYFASCQLTIECGIEGIGQSPGGIVAILRIYQEGQVEWWLAKERLLFR